MRSWLQLALGLCVLAACRSAEPAPERNGLPAFARSVRVETTLDPGELIDAVHAALRDAGYRSQGRALILTEPAPVGDVQARITARILESSVTAEAEFASGPTQAEAGSEAPLWRVARNAPGQGEAVFLQLQAIFHSLPHENVEFLFEE